MLHAYLRDASWWGPATDRKLEEMSSALQEVAQEIGGLETQKAELLRQLSLVQQDISAAQAKQVHLTIQFLFLDGMNQLCP